MNLETHLPLLLDLLLKSTAVLALAALLMAAFRRASAANRHAIAVAALVTLLVLPFTKLVQPRWSFALNQPAPAVPVTIKLPPITTMASSVGGQGAAMAVPVNAPVKAADIRVNWSAVGVGVWLAGFALVLTHRAGVGWRLGRLAAESRAMNDGRIIAMARELAAAGGVRAEIRESETCRVPLAFGMWRSTVLLPSEAMDWSDARLSAALQHEFGHIRRRDCLTRWFADLACAIYWMNPLVWLGARSLRLAQEQACDDLVLNAGARPGDYATQLVEIVRSLQEDRFTARQALAMAQPSSLETRVRAIVDESRDRSARSVRSAFAGVTFAAAALALCTAAQVRGADPRKPAPAMAPDAPQVMIEAKFIEFTGADDALPDFLKEPNLKPVPADEGAISAEGRFTEVAGTKGGVPDALNEPALEKGAAIQGVLAPEKAEAAFNALKDVKGVDVLSTPSVLTRSNQRAKIEIVREMLYTTEWEKDARTGAWKAAKFDTKNLGVTFEVTPEVKRDGAISLRMAPQVVEFAGFTDLDGKGEAVVGKPDGARRFNERITAGPDGIGIPEGHRAQAVFHTRSMATQMTVKAGDTIVLGGLRGSGAKAGNEERPRRLLVLVTARIAKPGGIPVKNPADVPRDPKGKAGAATEPKPLKIVSDEMVFDKKTGALSASGNVRIETAQAVITAASAEVTPNGGAAAATPAEGEKPEPKRNLPQRELKNASLQEVVDALMARGTQEGPAGKDLTIIIKNHDQTVHTRIPLNIGKMKLPDLLSYLTSLAGTEAVGRLDLSDRELIITIAPPENPFPPVQARGAVAGPAEIGADAKADVRWILPKVDFREAPLREAVDFLVAKSKTLDPAGTGVNVIIHDAGNLSQRTITLSLQDVPLPDVLRYVAHLTDATLTKEAFAYVLASKDGAVAAANPKGGAMKKAAAIVIPKLELQEATPAQAVDFLREKSRTLDPDGKGVNLVLKPGPGEAPKITLSLANVPLSEALRYIAALAGYAIEADDTAILLKPQAK